MAVHSTEPYGHAYMVFLMKTLKKKTTADLATFMNLPGTIYTQSKQVSKCL